MIRAAIDKLIETCLWIVLAAMAIVAGVNVFCRLGERILAHYDVEGVRLTIHWGDEVAQILLVWLTFLGAAVGVRENEHYYFNYLARKLRGQPLRILILVRDVLSIMAIGVLLVYSARVTWAIRTWIMPSSEISRLFVYGAAPVGCVFMLYYAVAGLIRHVTEPLGLLTLDVASEEAVMHAD